MAAIQCWRRRGMEDRCTKKATIFVKAFGDRSWEGYFCRKHSTEVIQMRLHLVKRHGQNVVVRAVTVYDKARVMKADKIKTKKGKGK